MSASTRFEPGIDPHRGGTHEVRSGPALAFRHLERPVPWWATALSAASLSAPVAATVWPLSLPGDAQVLMWLCGMIPVFLLSHISGWQGTQAAFLATMAVMGSSYAAAVGLGVAVPERELVLGVAGFFHSASSIRHSVWGVG